jgi:hypothetical protein
LPSSAAISFSDFRRFALVAPAVRVVLHSHQVVPKELLRVFNPEEMQVRFFPCLLHVV